MNERPGPKFLPGDPPPSEDVARMIRVDQAGEYGAVRIYAGQEAVLGRRAVGPVIREMAEQEARHLARFNDVVNERHVRPTVLTPVWHVMGYALGFGTAGRAGQQRPVRRGREQAPSRIVEPALVRDAPVPGDLLLAAALVVATAQQRRRCRRQGNRDTHVGYSRSTLRRSREAREQDDGCEEGDRKEAPHHEVTAHFDHVHEL